MKEIKCLEANKYQDSNYENMRMEYIGRTICFL